MSARDSAAALFGGVIILVLLVAGPGAVYAGSFHNERTETCTITSLDRTTVVRDGNATSDARVYTADCGTLQVRDMRLRGEFASADLYGRLHPGRWELRLVGARIGLFSWFPAILDARPVDDPAAAPTQAAGGAR